MYGTQLHRSTSFSEFSSFIATAIPASKSSGRGGFELKTSCQLPRLTFRLPLDKVARYTVIMMIMMMKKETDRQAGRLLLWMGPGY